jgi:hypothetical protein
MDGTSEMDHGWNPYIKTGLYEHFYVNCQRMHEYECPYNIYARL